MTRELPAVSVVLVSWNSGAHLPAALAALPSAFGSVPFETIVVDNASADDSVTVARSYANVDVIELDSNTGFTRGANIGARAGSGRYVLFLNPDVVAPAGSLAHLVAVLDDQPQAWSATPWFRNDDGTPQRFWRQFPGAAALFFCYTHRGRRLDRMFGERWTRAHRYQDLPDPPGVLPIGLVGAACLLVRRNEFEAASGFDERYFNFFQDTAIQRQMRRAGRELLGVGTCEIVHGFGVSFTRLPPTEVHGQFLYALRQYLAGEPVHRRFVGTVAIVLDVIRRGQDGRALRRHALAPIKRYGR